jgi:glycosyltransferase involved in cell wall biosynthesis
MVNDVRAQRRWPEVMALALAARAASREVVDPLGRTRSVTWTSVVRGEMPFLLQRTWRAFRIRGRVRRDVRRIPAAVSSGGIRPDRIAYLHADLMPELSAGGSLAHIHGVVAAFDRLGHEVTFATPGRIRGFHEDGRRVHRIPPDELHQVLPELPYLGYNAVAYPRLVEILRESGASLVYHRHALGHYAAAAAAHRCGLSFVVEFNGSEVWIAKNWGGGLPHEALFEEVERRSLRAADLVVAVSEPLRRQLHSAGVPDDRILVNPNGVDADRFDPDPLGKRRAEIRRDLGIGREELLVGFVGTFGPWHGAETLARAASRVGPVWSSRLRYLFVGDGERRRETESILEKSAFAPHATFTGLVPRELTPGLLAACDICTSPHVPNPDGSPFFGSPTKLFEYLASGRPVLASRLGQIAEVLDHGRNAWLVAPGDVDALAAGLEMLAADPDLRRRLGEAGREDARTRYSWTAHVKRILDRLAEPRPSAPGERR